MPSIWLSRSHILDGGKSSFSTILPHVYQLYKKVNHLVYLMANQGSIIKSHKNGPVSSAAMYPIVV